MNILVLHYKPHLAAILHCDQDVRTMLMNAAYLLSSAWHIQARSVFGKMPTDVQKACYPLGDEHDPCTVWVCAEPEHYRWLALYSITLLKEYQRRGLFGNGKCAEHPASWRLKVLTNYLPWNEQQLRLRPRLDPTNITGPPYVWPRVLPKDRHWPEDTVVAYRLFYRYKRDVIGESMCWTEPAVIPDWFDSFYVPYYKLLPATIANTTARRSWWSMPPPVQAEPFVWPTRELLPIEEELAIMTLQNEDMVFEW